MAEETDIQKMMKEMHEIKQQDKNKFDAIQYQRNKKKNKIKKEDMQNMLPRMKSKEEVYDEMKLRFKNSWKSPGYLNKEFTQVPILRAKVLTEWQYERIYLAERSYKYPPNYKGFKNQFIPQEFGEPDPSTLPKNYADYLVEQKKKYNDFRFIPAKYGKIKLDYQLEKLEMMNKEPFHYVNTVQQKDFGFDSHSTWECEVKSRLNQSKNQSSATAIKK